MNTTTFPYVSLCSGALHSSMKVQCEIERCEEMFLGRTRTRQKERKVLYIKLFMKRTTKVGRLLLNLFSEKVM
jgi:hypothetical protein